MPKPLRNTWPVLFLCLAVMLAACNKSATVKLCCQDGTQVGSDHDRWYCLNHNDAARLWIQTPADTSDQRARMEAFKVVYDVLDDCTTVSCIEDALQASTTIDGLWPRYQREHADAEARLIRDSIALTDSKKTELIQCGFTSAIQVDIQ